MSGIAFQWMGLRKVDYTKKCACDGKGCERCMLLGYVFTDYLIKAYMWRTTPGVEFFTQAGRISTEIRNVVIRHPHVVNKYDYLLQLDLDPDTGEPRQPFKIRRMFIIQNVIQMLGEDSKIQYWSCKAEERVLTDGRTPSINREL